MITVTSEVVLDSKLSEKRERIFWYMFLSCKLYQVEQDKTDILLYRTLFQGYNTILYFIRYQEYVLALKALLLLKSKVLAEHQINDGETCPSGKRFPRSTTINTVHVLKHDKV